MPLVYVGGFDMILAEKQLLLLQMIINAFIADFPDAANKSFTFDVSDNAYIEGRFEKDVTDFWGMCYYSYTPEVLPHVRFEAKVMLDPIYNEMNMVWIMYHELGHCLLGLKGHSPNEHSIMKVNQFNLGSPNFNYALKVMKEEYEMAKRMRTVRQRLNIQK